MKKPLSWLLLGAVVAALGWIKPAGAATVDRGWNQEQIIHVVESGENLFRISLRYDTTVDAIVAANGLTNANTVYAGQKLVIPGASVGSVASGNSESTVDIYTVQPGDTLSRLALRHGVTVADLMKANGLVSPQILFVRQRLVIPGVDGSLPGPPPEVDGFDAVHVVQAGDSLSKIAQSVGTLATNLAQLNGIANPMAIYPGQVLRLSGAVPTVPSGGGKRIVMDLSEQRLYAYEADRMVYSFVASSGAAPSYTRSGEFSVQRKISNAYGSTWDIWMPYWLGIYWAGSTENGIHALPILPNGQTLWAGYLGQPVSYGCIVLGTDEAQMLYNWAEVGTPVSIRN